MSGLEIVGIVASIVQVADLGAKISVNLCSFYRTVKNANNSMRSLSNDVSLTCSVLHELGKALEQDSDTKICSSGAFSTTQDILKECREVFEKIDSEIEKREQEKGTNRRLRGAQKFTLGFQGPDLDLLKSNLERLKSTMLLMLNVLMYAGQIRKDVGPGWVVHTYTNNNRRDLKATLTDQQNLIHQLLEEKKENDTTFDQLSRPTPTVTLKADEPPRESPRALSIDPAPPSSSTLEASTPTEVKEYTSLIRRLLSEIDNCQHSLEQSRVLRIRNGVANVHSVEVSLFQAAYGQSITQTLDDPFFKFRDTCIPRPHMPPAQKSRVTYALRRRYFSVGEFLPTNKSGRTQHESKVKSGSFGVSDRFMVYRRRQRSPNKPVDREVEQLILQWTTLTRGEMEIDVEEEVDENK